MDRDEQAIYQIKIRGGFEGSWSDWFNGMAIACESGITTLTGPVADQPALHGILAKIRNLNLTLLSVVRIEADANDESAAKG